MNPGAPKPPTVLEIQADLDSANLAAASARIDRLLAKREVRIVFDLEKVGFVDSSGINLLLTARKRAKAYGGDVVIARPSPFLRKMITTLRLESVLRVFDTTDEALRQLTPGGGEAAL